MIRQLMYTNKDFVCVLLCAAKIEAERLNKTKREYETESQFE